MSQQQSSQHRSTTHHKGKTCRICGPQQDAYYHMKQALEVRIFIFIYIYILTYNIIVNMHSIMDQTNHNRM